VELPVEKSESMIKLYDEDSGSWRFVSARDLEDLFLAFMKSRSFSTMEGNLTLDVGCGKCKRGDIGVDLQRSPEVDVICDAQLLPFRDNSFGTVFSSHVLDHLEDPELALLDWCRVARRKLVIYLPWKNGFLFSKVRSVCHKNKSKGNVLLLHRWSFSKGWFYKFGRKYGLNVQAKYSDSFVFPSEMEVQILPRALKMAAPSAHYTVRCPQADDISCKNSLNCEVSACPVYLQAKHRDTSTPATSAETTAKSHIKTR
jgi:SAM-dependent methyltransferase